VFTAHPDDESYTAAGTIYKNYEAGGKTILVCASFGERGTSHLKKSISPSKVKKMRREELIRAAKILHIEKLLFLGLPDAHIDASKSALYKRGLKIARSIKPDFIISFGKDGISGHRDHVAVGETAKKIAKRTRTPFIITALPMSITASAIRWLKSQRKRGRYVEKIHFAKPSIRIKINPKIKRCALLAHKSQLENGRALTGFPEYAVKELLKAEYFID